MYAYVVPLDEGTGRLNARQWLGGSKALGDMQTEFANVVGAQHGLERGLKGRKAVHQAAAATVAQKQVQELRNALEAERRRAEKANEMADLYRSGRDAALDELRSFKGPQKGRDLER